MVKIMKNKKILFIIISLFVMGILIGSLFSNGEVEISSDSAFYIEDKRNLFVVIAKFFDNIVYSVINLVFEGLKKVLEAIFGI